MSENPSTLQGRAQVYRYSILEQLRKDREDDPTHALGYGAVAEDAFIAGVKAALEEVRQCLGAMEESTGWIRANEAYAILLGLMEK